jgi:hypothetical protein
VFGQKKGYGVGLLCKWLLCPIEDVREESIQLVTNLERDRQQRRYTVSHMKYEGEIFFKSSGVMPIALSPINC